MTIDRETLWARVQKIEDQAKENAFSPDVMALAFLRLFASSVRAAYDKTGALTFIGPLTNNQVGAVLDKKLSEFKVFPYSRSGRLPIPLVSISVERERPLKDEPAPVRFLVATAEAGKRESMEIGRIDPKEKVIGHDLFMTMVSCVDEVLKPHVLVPESVEELVATRAPLLSKGTLITNNKG